MNHVIGICDKNIIYMKKLAEVFMQKSDIPLQIMTFSDLNQLIRYLNNSKLDILIVEENVYECIMNQYAAVNISIQENKEKEMIIKKAKYIVNLVDEKGGINKISENCFNVSRYQSSMELFYLIEQLLKNNFQKEDKSLINSFEKSDSVYLDNQEEAESVIIGVYSPVNRCGKTSLAVLLCELLQKKKSSIMICMDYYSKVFSGDKFNLSELIFCISGENNLRSDTTIIKDFSEYENYVKKWDKISYISAPSNIEDIYQITSEQLCKLIDILKYKSKYHYIVMDIAGGMENFSDVLEQCNIIFMPILQDCVSRCKLEQFENYMINMMGQGAWNILSDKICRIELPMTFEANNIENYYKELIWSNMSNTASDLLEKYGV